MNPAEIDTLLDRASHLAQAARHLLAAGRAPEAKVLIDDSRKLMYLADDAGGKWEAPNA